MKEKFFQENDVHKEEIILYLKLNHSHIQQIFLNTKIIKKVIYFYGLINKILELIFVLIVDLNNI
jgi:hypothetical protein